MEAKIQNLNLDLEELQQLQGQAKRPENQNFLKVKITEIQQQIKVQENKMEIEQNKQKEQESSQNTNQQQQQKQNTNINYKAITNYSFDNDGAKIKVYIFLDKIGELPKENIDHEFQKNSISLHIRDFNKQNLCFKIPQLQGEIIVEESKFIVKSNRITMILKKKDSKFWDQLAYKPKPDSSKSKGKDGEPDLMGLMKNMYDEGDDEMKRTLNKAWYESQNKKNKGGLGGMDMDI